MIVFADDGRVFGLHGSKPAAHLVALSGWRSADQGSERIGTSPG
jgi:hypothetical protein